MARAREQRLEPGDIMPGLFGGKRRSKVTRRISVSSRAKSKKPTRRNRGEHDDPSVSWDDVTEEEWEKKEKSFASYYEDLLLNENRAATSAWNIDDRDLPMYPNFYEFCLAKAGLGEHMYARQMWIAVQLLAEWCPKCSRARKSFRHIERIPVGFDVRDIPDKVVMLEYGRCPSCGISKAQLIKRGRLLPYTELVAIIGQRAGKALALDTPIPTPDGWTTMGKIKTGDTVFSLAGDQVEVTKAHPVIHDHPCYKVVFDTGEEIVCNAEHDWVTDKMGKRDGRRVYERGIRTTQEIAESLSLHNGNGTYVSRHSVPVGGALDCGDADLPIPPYTLGAWLGDGTSSSANITVADKSDPVLDSIAGEGFVVSTHKRHDSYKIDGLKVLLRENNLLNNKHIPKIYLRASYRQRLALLQGLMDTDGYADPRNGACEFTTTNKHFGSIIELIRSLGIKVNRPRRLDAKLNGRVIGPKWRVLFNPGHVPVFRLKYKLDRLAADNAWKDAQPRRRHSRSRRIVDAYPVKSVPVRCISVEPGQYEDDTDANPLMGGTYLCGRGMIPTHNSYVVTLIAAYIIHLWLKMPNPVEMLGLSRSSLLVGTVVGLTYQKAVELMWTPLYNSILQSEWFTEYHKMLDHAAKESGRDVYKFRSTFMQYNHRNLLFVPSGPNKRTLRGNTRIFAAIDELGWFPAGEEKEHLEKASGNEVYTSLDNSLGSIKGKAQRLLRQYPYMPQAYMLSISSPSSYWDKIMSLERAHKGSDDVLTVHLPTWEFNPDMPRSDPFIQKKYRENPEKAERDFGANPPMAEAVWLGDIAPILQASTGAGAGRLKYRYSETTSRTGQVKRYARLIDMDGGRGQKRGRILALDAGLSNNSFAGAIIEPRPNPSTKQESRRKPQEELGSVYGARIVALVEVAPNQGLNVVDHTRIYKRTFGPLMEEFNIRAVFADRWQSIKLLSDMEEDYGVYTDQVTLKPDNLTMVRNYLMDEDDIRIIFPKAQTLSLIHI